MKFGLRKRRIIVTHPSLLSGRRAKMALSLGGGGIPGWLYEVGTLAALDDLLGEDFSVNDFDIFCGTSAGSILATLLANGVSPDAVYKSIVKHEQTYLSLKREDFYGLEFRNILKTAWHLGKSALRGFFEYLVHPISHSSMDLLAQIQKSLPPGLFSTDRLRRFVTYVMERNHMFTRFDQLPKELYITATDLDTGERCVFGRGYEDRVGIPEAIAASSSVPLFYKPTTVLGRDFIDGGTGRVVHVDVPVENGAKLIFAVNPAVPLHNDKDKVKLADPWRPGQALGIRELGLGAIADQVIKIDSEYKLQLGIDHALAEDPELEIIKMTPPPEETFMLAMPLMDLASRVDVVNYGYDAAARYFRAHFSELRKTFGRFGLDISLERLEEKKIQKKRESIRPATKK